MKPEIRHMDAFTVVGVQCIANPNETLHKLWGEFMQRVKEITHVAKPNLAFQVCVFDKSNPQNEEYTFIAGMAVEQAEDVPDGMIAHKVAEAEYAVFEHKGTLDKLHQSYEYIFAVWLEESGYRMAEADSLEIYDERFIPDSPDSVLEILVPVIKA